jgi:hypothetical protein
MKLRSLFVMAAVCGAALFVMAPAAMASYGGDGGITVDDSTPKAGASITIDSDGWKADSEVTITLHSDPVVLDTVNADGTGNVSATVALPANTPAGAHTIELTGTDADDAPRTASVAITVSAADGSSLPRTGAAIAAMLGVGLVLFVVGSALSAARKRAIG